MEKIDTSFDYPIVIKHVHGFLTVSIPDLGIDAKAPIAKDFHKPDNLAKSQELIWDLICNVITAGSSHKDTKKWLPDPSSIKQQLKKPEKDYSLPEFCKAISKFMSISENTLRREIKKGKIICYETSGGHRRIPESEVQRYFKDSQTLKD